MHFKPLVSVVKWNSRSRCIEYNVGPQGCAKNSCFELHFYCVSIWLQDSHKMRSTTCTRIVSTLQRRHKLRHIFNFRRKTLQTILPLWFVRWRKKLLRRYRHERRKEMKEKEKKNHEWSGEKEFLCWRYPRREMLFEGKKSISWLNETFHYASKVLLWIFWTSTNEQMTRTSDFVLFRLFVYFSSMYWWIFVIARHLNPERCKHKNEEKNCKALSCR